MTVEREYVLGTDDEEITRLGLQHRAWRVRAVDAWRLAEMGQGQTGLDVGFGPGYAALDLAELVGPTGRVVAIDPSARFLEALGSPVFDPATSTRRFRLMMSDYVETVVMTEALPRIQKLAPAVTFELFSNDGSEVLERGEIEVSITPSRYLSAKHPSEDLFDDEYVCLVWSGNTQVQRTPSLDQYLSLGHVMVQYGRQRQLSAFDVWFGERFERRIEVITTTFNLVPQLLIGTSRIATVHRRLATFYEQYLPLRFVAPPLKIPRLEEFMQWHKSRDRDPGTAWLRSIFKSALGESVANERRAASGATVPRSDRSAKSPRNPAASAKVRQTR